MTAEPLADQLESRRAEVGVEGECVVDSVGSHEGNNGSIDEADLDRAAVPISRNRRLVSAWVYRDYRHDRNQAVEQSYDGRSPEASGHERERFDQDVSVGRQLRSLELGERLRGAGVVCVVFVEQRVQGRGIDEDSHWRNASPSSRSCSTLTSELPEWKPPTAFSAFSHRPSVRPGGG